MQAALTLALGATKAPIRVIRVEMEDYSKLETCLAFVLSR